MTDSIPEDIMRADVSAFLDRLDGLILKNEEVYRAAIDDFRAAYQGSERNRSQSAHGKSHVDGAKFAREYRLKNPDASLEDALDALDRAMFPAPADTAPVVEPVGWETDAEWQLEQRAFHWSYDQGEEDTRALINDLWQQYCLAAEATTDIEAIVSTRFDADGTALAKQEERG